MTWRCALIVILTSILCSSCDGGGSKRETTDESRPLRVIVTSYPLKYFAERIAGNHAEVVYLVPPHEDPAHWRPNIGQVRQFQAADLIIFNGAGHEPWAETVTIRATRIIDTSAAFQREHLVQVETVTHTHGPGGEHAHEGTDFNTWTDPLLAIQQSDAIATALAEQRPVHAESFRANSAALRGDLESLHERLKQATKAFQNQPMLASHPVYDYVARRYELDIQSMHWEPDVMPSEIEWSNLADVTEKHPAKFMLWEDDPSPEIAEGLNRLGIIPIVISTAGRMEGDGDYLQVWNANAGRLEENRP